MVKLAPNPAEGNPPPFIKGTGSSATPVIAQPDPSQHVIADVFKIINDPFVGKLSIFRIYQGTVRRDTHLLSDHGKKPFKVGHLFKLKGKEHIEIDEAAAGDICAVAKIDEVHFDAVLHDSHDEDHLHLKPIEFPDPMFGLAIEPATRGQEQKLSAGLQRLAEEDPCYRIEHHAELNELVVRGLGRCAFESDVAAPERTLWSPMSNHGRRVSPTAKRSAPLLTVITATRNRPVVLGNLARSICALSRWSAVPVLNLSMKWWAALIPGQYLPAVEKGVREVLKHGAVAGYPIQDVRVSVYDGKHHAVDSKEVAFVSAGKKAFLDAISKARPIILEPIVNLEVTAPDESMGDLTGKLSKQARSYCRD